MIGLESKVYSRILKKIDYYVPFNVRWALKSIDAKGF